MKLGNDVNIKYDARCHEYYGIINGIIPVELQIREKFNTNYSSIMCYQKLVWLDDNHNYGTLKMFLKIH